jgi:hypothetical protein
MVRMLTLLLTLLLPLLRGGAATAAPASAGGSEAVATVPAAQPPAVVVFFGYGEQIFDVGPLPELGKAARKKSKKKSRKKPKKKAKKRRTHERWLDGYRAGYRCQVLLIFWAYIYRWGCEPVVARNQVVLSPSSQHQTAKLLALEKAIVEKYKLSDHNLGWWGRNGRWVVGGILILLILSGIRRRMRRRRY